MLLWVFLIGFDFRCSCKVFKFSLTSVCWLAFSEMPAWCEVHAAFVVFSDTVYKYDVMCHAQ